MRVGSLFSGAGLLDYGLHLAGMEHEFFCESDRWRQNILGIRWPLARIHDDIRTFDGREWRGRIDVVAGGFPCKGASNAGKREGFGHPETVLWREMQRVIGESRPRYAIIENVAAILSLHNGAVWGEVLRDLASIGYDAKWECLRASDFGAPHQRDRVFLVATNAKRNDAELRGAAGAMGGSPGGGGDSARQQRTWSAATDSHKEVATDSNNKSGQERNQRPEAGEQASQRYDTGGRGVQVEWGEYGPAIRRWEEITRPAPEPLIRGVDDGSARGLDRRRVSAERKRVSAIGDGVLVQAAHYVGACVIHHAQTGSFDWRES